ncbi:MAG: GGDEF domain-containing protein [Patescibacteria group bacterium]
MEEDAKLFISLTDEDEIVLNFPDGLRHSTGLFPNEQEYKTAQAYFDTTIGRSIVMQLRSREIYDDLTELLLRAPARAMIQKTLERHSSKKFDGTMSLLVLDLDFFRDVNNTYGHTAGDRVLQWFSQILRSQTRGGDIVARWGGEEFVVVAFANKPHDIVEHRNQCKAFSDTILTERKESIRASTGTTAMSLDDLFRVGNMVSERIRSSAERSKCYIDSVEIQQTVTIGVATQYITPDCPVDGIFNALFERADAALREGKTKNERNRVHLTPLLWPKAKS